MYVYMIYIYVTYTNIYIYIYIDTGTHVNVVFAKVVPISPPLRSLGRVSVRVSLRKCMVMALFMWKEAARPRAKSTTLCYDEVLENDGENHRKTIGK